MRSMGSNYAYLYEVYPALKTVFEKFDYSLFDFTSISELGASDEEFIDGFHAEIRPSELWFDLFPHHK